ncbi:MAG: hypothetical protein G01um101456_694, partial [Parcubacteria group bacterium Gr01-1014_56]
PVSARWGRMLVEAEERRVLPDVITLVSIMEQGRITNRKSNGWKKNAQISNWSDAFVQLAAYEVALGLSPDQLEEHGIEPKAFTEAREQRHRLYATPQSALKVRRSTGQEKDIVCSIYAGLADCLYKKSVVQGYKDKSGGTRDLPPDSVVAGAQWVIGLPWNLQVRTDFGPKTLRLITMATRVDPDLLKEVAPHLVLVEEKKSAEVAGRRVKKVQIYFNGMLLTEEQKRAS